MLLWENICILAIKQLSVLKHCIMIGLCENFYTSIFGSGLSFRTPTKNIMIRYGNDFNRANVLSVKSATYKLATSRNLQY